MSPHSSKSRSSLVVVDQLAGFQKFAQSNLQDVGNRLRLRRRQQEKQQRRRRKRSSLQEASSFHEDSKDDYSFNLRSSSTFLKEFLLAPIDPVVGYRAVALMRLGLSVYLTGLFWNAPSTSSEIMRICAITSTACLGLGIFLPEVQLLAVGALSTLLLSSMEEFQFSYFRTIDWRCLLGLLFLLPMHETTILDYCYDLKAQQKKKENGNGWPMWPARLLQFYTWICTLTRILFVTRDDDSIPSFSRIQIQQISVKSIFGCDDDSSSTIPVLDRLLLGVACLGVPVVLLLAPSPCLVRQHTRRSWRSISFGCVCISVLLHNTLLLLQPQQPPHDYDADFLLVLAWTCFWIQPVSTYFQQNNIHQECLLPKESSFQQDDKRYDTDSSNQNIIQDLQARLEERDATIRRLRRRLAEADGTAKKKKQSKSLQHRTTQ